jgi:Na+/H+ antiporter NhaD/arsenite permease-like protein
MPPMTTVPLAWTAPFAGLLLAIATMPAVAPHWWEKNRNKAIVAALFALPVALWAWRTMPDRLEHSGREYIGFVVLLGSLFTISGGLFLDGDLRATPYVNAAFLGVGALLANLVGTTGAAMLLVRPLLRTNRDRRHVVHTLIFFIFVVCNTGGCLTPLGDPPLFVGYLRGVPFLWTLRLWPAWLALNAALLLVYLAWDGAMFLKEPNVALRDDRARVTPLRLHGRRNLLFLAGVIASVVWLHEPWREVAMVGLAWASWRSTPKSVHEKNHFEWTPIVEVAVLFAGIFVTMVPALAWLNANAATLGVREPRQFFWATGALSAFLDNTPTYLAFLEVARGLALPDEVVGTTHAVLSAIALGAVFMGALTYIGNGPNFMVRAIAERQGLKMPSFFGYMLWSVGILVPLFFATSLVLIQG